MDSYSQNLKINVTKLFLRIMSDGEWPLNPCDLSVSHSFSMQKPHGYRSFPNDLTLDFWKRGVKVRFFQPA